MSENVNFYQGSKEDYNPSYISEGLFFSKDSTGWVTIEVINKKYGNN